MDPMGGLDLPNFLDASRRNVPRCQSRVKLPCTKTPEASGESATGQSWEVEELFSRGPA